MMASALAAGLLLLLALAPPAPAASRRNEVVRAVEKAAAAVVNINTVVQATPVRPGVEEFYRNVPGLPPERRNRMSLGSGVIIDPQGYILTNEHVVRRAAEIRVTLLDKREFEGRLIGADPANDLAVVKIQAPAALPSLAMGRSDDLLIGETIIAIGNPFGLGHTVTTGVVSALQRSLRPPGAGRVRQRAAANFIQLDASINPGNSGGPLLNIEGALVGVNTAIFRNAQGIGFAIPIDRAKRIVRDLIHYGKVKRAWLGLTVQALTPALATLLRYPERQGVVVSYVMERSPAAKASLRRGDVISQVGSKAVEGPEEYLGEVRGFTAGDSVHLVFFREGRRMEGTLTASEVPLEMAEDVARQWLGMAVSPITEENRRLFALGIPSGVVVTEVQGGSVAHDVGIAPGDVIRQFDAERVDDIGAFRRAIVRAGDMRRVLLLVQRGTDAQYVTLEP